jgi:hypothetical protein
VILDEMETGLRVRLDDLGPAPRAEKAIHGAF